MRAIPLGSVLLFLILVAPGVMSCTFSD